MITNLEKLLMNSGEALCAETQEFERRLIELFGRIALPLIEVIGRKNGFYAFESSLHLFPFGCKKSGIDLEGWNDSSSWRKSYGSILEGYIFFAEDIFGTQFAISSQGIDKFDPETGELEKFAEDIEIWAKKILDDFDYETGYSLAHEWQKQNGVIPVNKRLLPKIPFVLGGEYKLDNLYAADSIKGMKYRAMLWKQIKELPDGSKVKLKIIE